MAAGTNPGTYTDALGNLIPYDGVSPVTWRIAGCVVALRDGKLLLVDHPLTKRWELPEGEVDVDEPLIHGAMRECWEETGYHFRASKTTPSYVQEQFFYRRGRKTFHHSLVVVFEGTVAGDVDPAWQPKPGEISEIAWVAPSELRPETTFALHWPALEHIGLVD